MWYCGFFALEAVENVGVVMTNLLKTQTKLESLKEKLANLGTGEGDKILDSNYSFFTFKVSKSHSHRLFWYHSGLPCQATKPSQLP